MINDPLYREAIEEFDAIYDKARELDVNEPDAMTVCTCDAAGNPTARVVLLRGIDLRGFVFYTNENSRKGTQLLNNPKAALCFYWDALCRQVRVEGTVEPVTQEENESYWSRRPRKSQIASVASDQSQVLDRRETYERRVRLLEQELDGLHVPRPEFWHGFRVLPRRIEFWRSRENRMHERVVYEWQNGNWRKLLLYP